MKILKKSLTKALIKEVKKRNILWDPDNTNYKNKSKRKEAWFDVCCHLIEDFMNLSEETQESILKIVKSKWIGIQEIYYIDNSKFKTNSALDEIRLSPLQNELSFLRSIPSMLNSWEHLNLESEEREALKELTQSSKENSNSAASTLEKYLSKQVESLEMDEDMAFFKSVFSSIKKLSHDDTLYFRIEAMQCLQKLLEKESEKNNQQNSENNQPNSENNQQNNESFEKIV